MSSDARTGALAGVLLLLTLVGVYAGVALLSDGEAEGGAPAATHPEVADDAVMAAAATCSTGGASPERRSARQDVVAGPLVLVGGRRWARSRRDAFHRRGFKVPVTLKQGAQATLSVPASLRGRVGLVYSLRAQDRVLARGMRGADASVRFTACPAGERPGRTGWGGGLVVDRPRCASVIVTEAQGAALRRRVPLGRRC